MSGQKPLTYSPTSIPITFTYKGYDKDFKCFKIPFTPPYVPCTCASTARGKKCDCPCHGPKRKKVVKTLPIDPDQFKTTNGKFHTKPDDEDYNQGYPFKGRDNLHSDPNMIPLTTEQQREFTPKKAEIPQVAKPRDWKYGQPIDGHTIQKDHYKAPNKDDYPDRASVPQGQMKTGPGEYDTTYRDTYVKPTEDQYQPVGYTGGPKPRESLPGRYNTEYTDKYVGDPTEPSSPYKQNETPLGGRPVDFKTTQRDHYTPPKKDDYPERVRDVDKDPYKGPLERPSTTYQEDYVKQPFEDPLTLGRPQDSKINIGPNGPYLSTTHDTFGPKEQFCCPCVLR